ncbi:putative NADH-flavin reductase [Paenibacillus endophyticus]|uniref:Putative NADH-flavin reductase n=1 Tax=Paenibacillus endophyticus TaxID=1294268 RepID=A0A7W5C7L0_9BACL|nr:NAD(P)H-binding protein [Paenibacillus endophyticus]MBB3151534.1 putative NADH-flavin reductase [Paenibacillus endophyticus]
MVTIELLLFGATGKTGQYIARYLTEQQVSYRRFVRSAEQMLPGSFLGDVRIPQDVDQAMTGVTCVICALNTEGNGTLASGLGHIIEAMKKHKIRRLITIGTAGILQSEVQPHLYRYLSVENKRIHHEAAIEHESVYNMLLQSEQLDWTVICPTRLVEEERTGEYRVRKDVLPTGGTAISFADTAAFAVDVYMNEKHIRERVGIAY